MLVPFMPVFGSIALVAVTWVSTRGVLFKLTPTLFRAPVLTGTAGTARSDSDFGIAAPTAFLTGPAVALGNVA